MADSESEFACGTLVKLLNLNKKGRVVRKVNKRDYVVKIGAAEVRVARKHLAAAENSSGKTARNDGSRKPSRSVSERIGTLDLHGLTVQGAIEKLETIVDKAIVRGDRGLQVIHGIGSGKIKQALYTYAAQSEVIAEVRPDPANAGVSWVYFYSN